MNNLKKHYLIIIIILVLNMSCTRNQTPVGPYVDIQPENETINLNNYAAVRTNLYYHFSSGNLHGFTGVWISPGGGSQSFCLNTNGNYLEMGYTNLQPKDNDYSNPYGFYGTRIEKIWGIETNLLGNQDEDKILVLQFKAKCRDESKFKPARIYVEFVRTKDAFDNGCKYNFSKPIPSSWASIAIPFAYFIKSDDGQPLSIDEVMKKAAKLKIGTDGSLKATTAGQYFWLYLDDFRIVVYKRKY